MEISTIIPHLEALVFASEKPLSTLELTDLVNTALGFIDDRASLDQVESALSAITEKYQSEFYPFEVKQSGGGWQFLTKPVFHKTVAQLNGEKFLKRLSTAALETLSIIAYKQPVTKGEIENIRGVNCDYAVQKLLEKELIMISGRRENSPGQPLIYVTSKNFMDYFGINSPADLPKLTDIVGTESAEGTMVGQEDAAASDDDASENDDNTFVVTENGSIEEIRNILESQNPDAIVEAQKEIAEVEGQDMPHENEVSAEEPGADMTGQDADGEMPEEEIVDNPAVEKEVTGDEEAMETNAEAIAEGDTDVEEVDKPEAAASEEMPGTNEDAEPTNEQAAGTADEDNNMEEDDDEDKKKPEEDPGGSQ